jgi:hypothetical protein
MCEAGLARARSDENTDLPDAQDTATCSHLLFEAQGACEVLTWGLSLGIEN